MYSDILFWSTGNEREGDMIGLWDNADESKWTLKVEDNE